MGRTGGRIVAVVVSPDRSVHRRHPFLRQRRDDHRHGGRAAACGRDPVAVLVPDAVCLIEIYEIAHVFGVISGGDLRSAVNLRDDRLRVLVLFGGFLFADDGIIQLLQLFFFRNSLFCLLGTTAVLLGSVGLCIGGFGRSTVFFGVLRIFLTFRRSGRRGSCFCGFL